MNRKEFLAFLSLTPVAMMGVSPFAKGVQEDIAVKSEGYENLYNPSEFDCLVSHNGEEIAVLKNIILHCNSSRNGLAYKIESELIVSYDYDKIMDIASKAGKIDCVIDNENHYYRIPGYFDNISYNTQVDIMSGTIAGSDYTLMELN